MTTIVAIVALLVLVANSSTTAGSVGPTAPPWHHYCGTKIAICGAEVSDIVFSNGAAGTTVSPNCCRRLLWMGKKCHERLVQRFVSRPSFKGDVALVLANGRRIWNACVSVPPGAF